MALVHGIRIWQCTDARCYQGVIILRNYAIFFATGATAHTGAYFGEGSGPIHLDIVQCSGSEYNLTECEIRNDRVRTNHSIDVGVKCQPGRVDRVDCL